MTDLNIEDNDLDNRTGKELAMAFAHIPAFVNTLRLGDNNLGNKSGEELAEIFAKIPLSVTSLDLRYNELGKRNGKELAIAFAKIPSSVTNLNLKFNHLGKITGEELAMAFANIPTNVDSLVLANNELGAKSGEELAKIFSKIPASITSLNMGNDWFAVIEKLSQQKMVLSTITHVAIDYSSAQEHSAKLKLLATVFPNLNKVTFMDIHGNNALAGQNPIEEAKWLKLCGIKNSVPSLLSQALFFVAKNKEHRSIQDYPSLLPKELTDSISSLLKC